MPIKVQCPNCETYLSAPEELVGEQARCINCDEVVTVPPADEATESDSDDAPTGAGGKKKIIVIAAVVAIVVIVVVALKALKAF